MQGGSLLSHGSVGDDDAVSWIEEVASTGSTTNAIANTGNGSTSVGTADTPNNTTTLSPAEVQVIIRVSVVEICAPMKSY